MHQWTAQLEASETERKQMEEALAKGAFSSFPKKFGGLPLQTCPYLVHFLTKVTRSSAIMKTPIIASAAPIPLAQPVGCGAQLP